MIEILKNNYMNAIKSLQKLILRLSPIVILLIIISCKNAQVLFQENTEDWKLTGDAKWVFNDHELIGKVEDGAGYIITKQKYQDFVLELEFNPDSNINSGVFIRCKNEELNPINCYEINIWDLHPNQEYRTGAIVMKSTPLNMVETIYKWNTYKIRIQNDHVQVWINDILTADLIDDSCQDGYIGLQAMGTGEIRFRNMKIYPLNPD